MPDIISDRAHHRPVITNTTKPLARVKSKRLSRFCKATRAFFQPKRPETRGTKSTASPAQQDAAKKAANNERPKEYTLPTLRSSPSFGEACLKGFDEIRSKNDNGPVLRAVVCHPPVIVENKNGTVSSSTLPCDADASKKSLALTKVNAHPGHPVLSLKDSFDLVRAQKPHLVTPNHEEESTTTESMSSLVRRTVEFAPNDQALAAAGTAYLRAAEAAKPTAEKPLTVKFKQQREQQSGGLETIKEITISMSVTQQTTMQELRCRLQREAAEHVIETSTLPGEVFGAVFLVISGSPAVLKADEWELMRCGLPSNIMNLLFCFQVRELAELEA